MTYSRFHVYATMVKGLLVCNLRSQWSPYICRTFTTQSNTLWQMNRGQAKVIISRRTVFQNTELHLCFQNQDSVSSSSPTLRSVRSSHSWSNFPDSKIRSKYGKALASSKVHRGKRKGSEKCDKLIKETSVLEKNKSATGNEASSDIGRNVQSGSDKIKEQTYVFDDQHPKNLESLLAVPENINVQTNNGSTHDIFDVEYFGKITKALTDSNDAHVSEVSEELPNLFDKQYFESVVNHLTHQGPNLNDNDASNTDLAKKEKTSSNYSITGKDHDSNFFDQLYFGDELSSIDQSDKQSNDTDITDMGLLGNVTKGLTDSCDGSASEVLEELPNHFDEQYFESIVKHVTNQNTNDDHNDHHKGSSFDQLYFRNASSLHQSNEQNISEFENLVEKSREEVRNVPLNEKPDTDTHSKEKESSPRNIDTFQSESDFFLQEFLKAEASRRLEPTSESRPKLKGDFALAEVNVTVDSFTIGNDNKESSLMSLSSKQLEISLKDKIKLEAEREILERTLVAGNSELDLEPTVENVLLGTKKQKALKKPKTSLEMKIAGSPDPNVPISEHHCSGCGAQVHCQDESRPGYIPSEKFKPLTESNALEDAICQRCWYFINHKRALNVNVNVSDYSKIVSAIKSKKAHILLMVDLLDFPCSVIPNLKDLLGNTTPMFIVGNKYDLLPKDAPSHHKRVEKIVLETCIQENVCDREQVSRVHLISAKTGFGVEKLITLLQGLWGSRKDIYLLGTANIGKSTLFTTLLNSDFSKTKASYMIKQPTISPWPGTTLNLLKFPILRPTQDKVMVRRARLKAEAEDALKEKRADIKLRAYWKENVGRSFSVKLKDQSEDLIDEHLPVESEEFADPFNTMSLNTDITEDQPRPETKPKKKQLPFRFTPMEFESGKWFFDTPGVLHDRQVLTHLTMDELKLTMTNRVIIPRTLIIKPGQVIFLGGLGRLDYVQGVDSVYFTVFASEEIPVRYCSQDEAEEFYTRHAGESYFKVPIGGADRMKTFPKLLPTDYKVMGSGWQESASDVLLSSAGWVAITAGRGMDIHLRAFTPNGHGCFLRHPALLPFAVNMKGRRLSKQKPFYHADPKAVLKYR